MECECTLVNKVMQYVFLQAIVLIEFRILASAIGPFGIYTSNESTRFLESSIYFLTMQVSRSPYMPGSGVAVSGSDLPKSRVQHNAMCKLEVGIEPRKVVECYCHLSH